ncbi:hypothetical protein HZS_926 [Henneguya salminicola]|nr:hypothetical protein HZS_926 [Henneguya salminicola]
MAHNLGECLQYGDFMFCLCIRNEYTGENCEKQCSPKCEEGNNCTESENVISNFSIKGNFILLSIFTIFRNDIYSKPPNM